MTIHRMSFNDLSSNEFFWGVQLHRNDELSSNEFFGGYNSIELVRLS